MSSGFPDLENALKAFEEEKKKLVDFQQKLKETSTSVTSAKRLMTLTMDGHGQFTDVKFNTSAYRSMPPSELASIVLETLQKARVESMGRMQELMGGSVLLQGMNVDDVSSGKADFGELLGSIAKPSMDLLKEADAVLPDRSDELRRLRGDEGWERS